MILIPIAPHGALSFLPSRTGSWHCQLLPGRPAIGGCGSESLMAHRAAAMLVALVCFYDLLYQWMANDVGVLQLHHADAFEIA
jgi:hypothetical protein